MGIPRLQRFILFGMFGFASITVLAQSEKKDAFWEPYLDQPIQQLEEVLSKLNQQQPKNYTIANISFLYDAKLYILFNKYLEGLPEPKRPSAMKDQSLWLVERGKAMDKEDSEYKGGSMAPYMVGEVKIQFTKKRIKVVEQLLKSSSRDS